MAITISNLSITNVTSFSITEALEWARPLQSNESPLNEREKQIGKLILKEIYDRLNFLISVGLEYLTLSRQAGSLSGGEAQRIRLASQIGSGLTGVLYVLDEPTIGLHPRDNQRLIDTLKKLRDLGNTVVVVEHDRDMMKQSDHIVDIGPGAGKHGGEVVATGSPKEIAKNPKDAELYKELGQIYLKTGEDSDAFESFKKALELNPGDAETKAKLNKVAVKLENPPM